MDLPVQIALRVNMDIEDNATHAHQDSMLHTVDWMYAFPVLQEQWRRSMNQQHALHVVKELPAVGRLQAVQHALQATMRLETQNHLACHAVLDPALLNSLAPLLAHLAPLDLFHLTTVLLAAHLAQVVHTAPTLPCFAPNVLQERLQVQVLLNVLTAPTTRWLRHTDQHLAQVATMDMKEQQILRASTVCLALLAQRTQI